MQGGGCQAAAAAPDEAQGRRAVSGVVLTSPCQQHLYTRLKTVSRWAEGGGGSETWQGGMVEAGGAGRGV